MKFSKLQMATLLAVAFIAVDPVASAQITGFGGNGTGWTLNGTPSITGNVLTLVNSFNQANSAFFNAPQNINDFTVSFVWQNTVPVGFNGNFANPAHGMVFTLQNKGSNAVGTFGSGLGYTGIAPATGVAFNLYSGYTVGLGYAPNSTGNDEFNYKATGPVNFDSTDPIGVSITYDNLTEALSVVVTDNVTLATYSTSFTVNLTGDAGGSAAYVGFTGGSGAGESVQTISNFSFAPFVAPTGHSIITDNLPANTAIINISGTQDGAANYSGANQALWYQPFYTGGATNLLEYTVQPGTYNFRIIDPADAGQIFPTLTSAQTSELFTAWTYNSPWIDDYLVFPGSAATNSSIPQIFDGAPFGAGFSGQDAITEEMAAYDDAITNGYYNEIRTGPLGRASTDITNAYTFTNAQTLIFAVPDYGLSDNAGGVSVAIIPISDLPTILPPGSPIAFTNAVHLLNDSGQDVVNVLQSGSPFVTDFKSMGDITVTGLGGPVAPENFDVFGGTNANYNPYYAIGFVGTATAGDGDGIAGDIREIGTSLNGALQFDFAGKLTPNDRLLVVDVDNTEQYLVQAYVKTGFVYTQVPVSGWTVSNYAGMTQQQPSPGTSPLWNPSTGVLSSQVNTLVNDNLVGLAPDRAIDRVVITQTAGSGNGGIQFIGGAGPVIAPPDQNVLANGNFSSGDTGFSSSYTFGATGSAPGQFGVTSNPHSFNGTFASFGDHTTGSGLMMVVEGATAANSIVWSETVPVEPFTQYLFSYWAAAADASHPPIFQATLNGVNTGPTNTLPSTPGQWQQFQFTWNSGTNTIAALAITDQNLNNYQNDFVMDDFSFAAVTGGIPLADQTVPCGSGVSFTVAATSSAPLSYQWWEYYGSGFFPIYDSTNATLTYSSFYGIGTTEFYVVVSSPYGSVKSSVATVTVQNTAPPIFQSLGNSVNPNGALVEGTNGNFYGTTSGGGANNLGSVFEVSPSGVLTTLYSFTGGNDGQNPACALVLGTNGNFYGTTQYRGTNNSGTIFEITHSGVLTTLTGSFGAGGNPGAGLTLGTDGNFYGTTSYGGTNGLGTVFQATPTGVVTTLYNFIPSTGGYPCASLVLGRDTNFYGTTMNYGNGYGTIFKITPTGVFTLLHAFVGGNEGSDSQGALVQGYNGNFYGTTVSGGANNEGTIFEITPSGTFTTLYTFSDGADGSNPPGGLTLGYDGNFYGVSEYGSSGGGAVFSITPAGEFNIVYQFSGVSNGNGPTAALDLGSDGNFYGTTSYSGNYGNGTVFVVTPSGDITVLNSFQAAPTITVECHNAFSPPSAYDSCAGYTISPTLVSGSVDTNLPGDYTITYSATASDGISVTNTFLVKVVDTTPPVVTPVGGNGFNPNSGLISGPGGNFFGTTLSGGTYNQGTIFSISPIGLVTNIYSFTGTNDGGSPAGVLVLGPDGNFYGGTTIGGTGGQGTLFKITTSGILTTLHAYSEDNDQGGVSGLTLSKIGSTPANPLFYGTTQYGGTNSAGSVFSVTGAGVFTTLYSFAGGNDGYIAVGVVQGSDGNLYGTTEGAGGDGDGTVFQLTLSGELTTLYSFAGDAAGSSPSAGLIQGTNGNFYGITEYGGTVGNGTIFEITPAGVFNSLLSFTNGGENPNAPGAPFTLGSDGNFYGVAENAGTNSSGGVFELTESGQFTLLHTFDYSDGSAPTGTLTQGSDGDFYGTTKYGGVSDNGSAFKITPSGTLSSLTFFGGGITLPCGSAFTDPGATANDTCAGSIVPVLVGSTVNTTRPGIYTVEYSATDPSTNTGYFFRPVTIVDSAAPMAVLNGSPVVNVVLGTSFADPGVTALDACGEAAKVIVSGNVNVNVPGVYTITYVATTGNGLTTTNYRTVEVTVHGSGVALPSTLTNALSLWLRADFGVTTNGNLTASGWTDESGGNHSGSQGTSTSQPYLAPGQINGLPSMHFSGGQFFNLAGQVLTSQTFTVVAMMRDQGVNSGFRELFSDWLKPNNLDSSVFLGTQNRNPTTVRFTDNFGGADQGDAGAGVVSNPASFSILTGVSGASSVTVYQNTNILSTRASPLSPRTLTDPYVIGTQGNSGSEFWVGDIAEMLVFNKELSNTELSEVWNYLENKYEAQSGCTPPPSGLAAWWPGQNNTIDIVGGDDGYLNNGASFAEGIVGDSFNFGGGDEAVVIPYSPGIDLTSLPAWTVEAWVNPTGFSNSQHPTIYSCGDWNVSLGLNNSTGALESWINDYDQLDGSIPVPLGEWSHVAMTFDGTNRTLYINGVRDGSDTPDRIYASPVDSAIGSVVPIDNNSSFNGMIDEVSVYNRALSATEISSIYDAAANGKCIIYSAPIISAFVPVSGSAGNVVTVTGSGFLLTTNVAFNGVASQFIVQSDSQLIAYVPSSAASGLITIRASTGSISTTHNFTVTAAAACDTAPSGLLGWWPGDGNAADILNQHNGTLANGATFAPGYKGQAFSFDGINSDISLGNFSPGASWTIEGWVNPSALPDGDHVIAGSANDCQSWAITLVNGQFAVESEPPGNCTQDTAASVPIVPGSWYHVAGTCDGTNTYIYVNGVLQNLAPVSLSYIASASEVEIGGASCCPGTKNFAGMVDELSIYNRALSPTEVAALYNAGAAGKCAPSSTVAISLASSPPSGGSVSGAGSFASGTTVTVNANPNPRWVFVDWTENGFPLSSNASYSFSADSSQNLVANFVGATNLIVQQPLSQTNELGSQAVFAATAFSPGPLLLQWYFGSAPVAGATNTTLVLTNLLASQAGGYTLVARNSFGSVTSAVANLTIVVTSVHITSPVNGVHLIAPASLSVTATASDPTGLREVDFYTNGVFCGPSESSTGSYNLSLTALPSGSYGLSAVAVDQLGLMATSAVVHITVNSPGSTLIDFEALDASMGPVGGLTLSNYLSGFGVGSSNVVPATAGLAVVNDQQFLGGGAVQASSGDDFLAETGANGAVSYTLYFTNAYASVGWVRPRLLAGTVGVSLPGWRAHALDNTGKDLGSVGETALVSYADVPAAPFTLLGPNIWAIRFDGNNQGVGSLATLPLDDLLLSTKATNTSLLVSLTSGVQSVLTAPGTAVLQATVSDTAGTVSSVQFYEGANLVGTASVSGGTAVLSLSNLASGSYVFTAVAMDNLGASRSSTPLNLTVASGLNVSVINFDAPLNTANGSVGGSALSNYLYGFGVVLSNATVGTAMEAVNPGVATGSGGSVASSPPNYFTQEGLSTPVSFTLGFMHSLQSFGFTRVGLVAGSGGVSHPQWKGTIFGTNGTVLGLVGEGLIQSATNVPARSFVLSAPSGSGIASVRFDSDSQKTAAFSAVLLDDLILDAAASNPELSVTVLSPANGESGFVAPANITLSAAVNDTLGNNYYVSFYAGPNLIGSVSNAPYNVAWTNVLAGTYVLRAEAVDASGLAAYSSAVNITVGSGGNAQVANFDLLTAPATGTALNNYLSPFGMSLGGVTVGSQVTVESQSLLGGLVAASSPPNVLTQVGVSGPVSYTVNFGTLLTNFGFTRPELVALPFVSHPAWEATAYDGAGVAVASVGEGAIGSYANVGASAFSLSGPGIASVQFASEGTGLESFKGMVADDFVLTPGTAPFPPAVAITNPATGLQLVGSVLPVSATAVDATGVTGVGFYANGVFIGSSLTAPYGVLWTNQGAGGYVLTAVATNHGGLLRMSPPVTVSVLPAAYQFGILTQPSSQVAATGGTVVFTVVASGTNTVTYQWYQNQNLLTGQTGPGLTLSPVGAGDVGTYTVQLSSGGETLSSAGAVLEVLDPPTFVVPPASQSVAAGVNILMTNQVDGDGPLSWQWLLNGTSIAGATNSTYAIQSAQPLNSGSYQVVAANAAAFSVSAPAQVTIQAGNGQVETADDFTNRISINPLLGAVMGNNQSATSEPHEPMHDGKPGGKSIWYTWHASFTGVISLTTLGSDFDTLLAVYTGTNVAELTPVAADDDSGGFFTSLVTFNVTAGTDYQIAVDGFKGASGNVVLGMPAGTGYRVLAPGSGSSVPVISVQPTNQLVAAGSKVTLTVAAANAQTYQWYFQGLPVSGANGASLVINNFQAGAVGLYDVLVANAAGSVESEQASVQVAVVNQTGGDTSAQDKFGDAVDLAAKIGAKSSEPVTPSAGGGDTRGFSISQTFSTVGATKEPGEPNTCGQAGGASQWYIYTAPAAGTLHVSTDGSTFNTILGVYTGPGTSFATLTNVGCDYTTNYQTKGQPSVVIAGVAANTRFYITVDGYQGASGRAQLQVGLGAGAPTFVSLPTNEFVVAGNKATFNVTAQGTTPLSYQWQLNGATVPKATNTTYTVANAQSGFAGSYTVVVSNVVGVVTSTPPALLVIQYAPGITAQPASQTVVMGRKSTLTASAVGVNTTSNPIKYQWYFNGAPKAGATGPTLTFPAVNWTNGGSYYLVATNGFSPMYGGPSTSQVAVLTVKDTVPPVVTIVSPSTKTTSTQSAPLTVSGTASDAAGVQAVYVEVNNSGFQLAAGSTSWSLPVTLVPGSNVLTAQAVDLAGNTNTTLVRRNIFYAVSSMLTLVTNVNGVGKVTSTDGATNGATLVIGQNYIVNASVLPGMNWLFDKWSSGAANLGTSNSLKFAMSSNLVLQANFITNPFPALAGVYNGLFYPTSGVTESNSGYVSLTLTASLSGAYSAQVLLNGSSNRFTGTFNAQGQSRHALAGGVVVWLAMDLNPADDLLGGTVSNAAWSSPIVADRAGTAAVANYAGQYTLLLPPRAGAPVSEPDGFGYAAISNSAGGVSTLTGVLADGSAFTRATTVAKDGSVPFYLSLYSGKGSLLGWIIFTNPPAQSFPAVLGSASWVEWIKLAQPKTFYPNGFNELITNLPASYYTNATLNGGPELDLPNATLTLSNGNLSTPLVYNLVLDNGVLTNQNSAPTNYLAISNSPAYGTLTITFRPTGSKTNVIGHTAILQNQTNAQGSFTGSSQSGTIILR